MSVISQAKLPSDEHHWTLESTLFQVMAWCRQATSHYLKHCWPRSLPPYDVTRPQWVKHQGPFSISYLEAQVTSNFSSKSLEHYLSSLQVTFWKPNHLAKSQVTSVDDLEISWVALSLTLLFVVCIFLNSYMWHYMVCFTRHIQKAVSVLFTDKLYVRWHQHRQHHRP